MAVIEFDRVDLTYAGADRATLHEATFALPEGELNLDRNSLGAAPRTAQARARQVIAEEWGEGLIRSWNTAGWFDLPRRLGGKLAPPAAA